jgi:hypothetical protein
VGTFGLLGVVDEGQLVWSVVVVAAHEEELEAHAHKGEEGLQIPLVCAGTAVCWGAGGGVRVECEVVQGCRGGMLEASEHTFAAGDVDGGAVDSSKGVQDVVTVTDDIPALPCFWQRLLSC